MHELSAVGDEVREDERLVILLGSLTSEYDSMVRIIEAQGNFDLHEAKEMFRRECDTMQKREKQETAFKAVSGMSQLRGRRSMKDVGKDNDRNVGLNDVAIVDSRDKRSLLGVAIIVIKLVTSGWAALS